MNGALKEVLIYIRFSISRDLSLNIIPGFSIDTNSWSSSTKLPKQNNLSNKSYLAN